MADDEEKRPGGKDDEWEAWSLPWFGGGGEETDWPACPQCESNHTVPVTSNLILVAGVVILGISIFLFIIPPLGLAGVTVGIILILFGWSNIAANPADPVILRCNDCGHGWDYIPLAAQGSDGEPAKPRPTALNPYARPASLEPKSPPEEPPEDRS